MKNCDEMVKLILALLNNGSHAKVIEVCDQLLLDYPRESRFWNLLGCALGDKGYHDVASRCFIAALAITGFRCGTMTNLISSTFGRQEPELACRQIDKYFQKLCQECQRNVLTNVLEALKIGHVNRMNLPKCVADLIENVEAI